MNVHWREQNFPTQDKISKSNSGSGTKSTLFGLCVKFSLTLLQYLFWIILYVLPLAVPWQKLVATKGVVQLSSHVLKGQNSVSSF